MSNREHLMCLAAVTALVASPGVARADDYSLPNTERFGRSEQRVQPLTCAQATAFAWFQNQMELSDGMTHSVVATPAECERTHVARSDAGDRETVEEK